MPPAKRTKRKAKSPEINRKLKKSNTVENEPGIDTTDLEIKIKASMQETKEMFLSSKGQVAVPIDDLECHRMKLASKLLDEYNAVKDLPEETKKSAQVDINAIAKPSSNEPNTTNVVEDAVGSILDKNMNKKNIGAIVRYKQIGLPEMEKPMSRALALRRPAMNSVAPEWHAPWKLMRVISGHLGWVRSIAVDPTNEFFVTGSTDRTIKVWDLASGRLKLTLTGHINAVRGLAISDRHTYLYSCGEDKLVNCWDLEYNKVIRHYHGHLSGVFSISLHPTVDVLVTGGRDACARVWDARSKNEIHLLGGHTDAVGAVATQGVDPQVITGSMDGTIRLWDLVAGKTMSTLTNHKKGVRSIVLHPREFTFASGAADNIKKWKFPHGDFLQNLSDHRSVINTLAINDNNVMVSGGDDGTMNFWDWKSGHCFQKLRTTVQPGSLDCEAGILASCFDKSGSRYITCESDKTIKFWKEDETATPETHPIDWKPNNRARRY